MLKVNEGIAAAHAALDECQRRFDQAAMRLPNIDVATAEGRDEVRTRVRQCLGIDDRWIPQPDIQVMREARQDSFTLRWLAGTSWPKVHATALLYVPDHPAGDTAPPLVMLGCGHGNGGKLNPGYQQMARMLARRGAMVLCPDNIGQGERVPMGHRDTVVPFACGLSIQGLIVMETLAWLTWARRNLPVDHARVAAIGNSGGGLLTQMLIPFDEQLAVVCSTGYPSTYSFIARKEKKHCHCNVLPGIASALEMHHVYGCFAPKPLLLMQGQGDHLFPEDLFHLVARRVSQLYDRMGAADQLTAVVTRGGHSWDDQRRQHIAAYLTDHLKLHSPPTADADDPSDLLDSTDTCHATWPVDAYTVDQLACELTGQSPSPNLQLWDVFPYVDDAAQNLAQVTDRGDIRQILAQMKAFLGEHQREPDDGGSHRKAGE